MRQGRKLYTVRQADRPFSVGDVIVFQEFEQIQQDYTGEQFKAVITCITGPGEWGLPKDICVLGIRRSSRLVDDIRTYRRRFRPEHVYMLRKMYRKFDRMPVSIAQIEERKNVSADFEKLRFWGLIEPAGKNKYRITDAGVCFLSGMGVKKYVFIRLNQQVPQPEDFKGENPLVHADEVAPDTRSKHMAFMDSRPFNVLNRRVPEEFQPTMFVGSRQGW